MADENRDLEKGNSAETLSESSMSVTDPTDYEEDQSIGKARSESIATSTTSDGPPAMELEDVVRSTPVTASVMTQNLVGADLEKAPPGPPNRTMDENGKVVVNWVSLKDPENPKNWPRRKKIFNVVIVSAMTFLCPLSSSIFVCSSHDCTLFLSTFVTWRLIG